MVVQHNITAMNANRYYGINNSKLASSLEKLSSGYKINRAGDDAAGLAVSEKMRSQIAGMTQGVKNAQDGISMVQTFEGALTETHSILQRMKTLADQMSNGSYDDPVDRTAAQQEFYQLSDELDQIADTDYNGVVVLNGGKMADGLEQVDGEFNYANKASQVKAAQDAALADAQAAAQKNIDSAQKAFNAALAQYQNMTDRDLCLSGEAVQWNTVDNSQYNQDAADLLFNNIDPTTSTLLGWTATGGAAPGDTSLTGLGVDSIDVTYKYNDTSEEWEIDSGSYVDTNGQTVAIDVGALKNALGTVTTTDNGGFIVSKGTSAAGSSVSAEYGNAVLETGDVKGGDVVTLTYTHKAESALAPSNIGMDMGTYANGVKGSTMPTLTLDADIQNATEMNAETAAALEKLDNANIELAYNAAKITATIDQEGLEIEDTSTGNNGTEWEISYTNEQGVKVKLAKMTASAGEGPQNDTTGNNGALTVTGVVDNTTFGAALTNTLTYDSTANSGSGGWTDAGGDVALDQVDVSDGATTKQIALDTAIAGLSTSPRNGDKINISVTATPDGTNTHAVTATYAGQAKSDGTVGKITFGVALDQWDYDPASVGSTIKPATSKSGKDSRAIDQAYIDTKKALADANAAYPKTYDDLPDEYKVSTSDAFDNSEAIMTYKDNITLQVGARTKDAVNFTFQYDSDAIGDLKADLNCTATGLGIDKLDIKTQDSANYAIDKIDQAINKVSLIRGSFGAIQNRLNHKIDNMNVSIENLTDAESQIRDTDMSTEMMEFTKNQILAQASQSMLAQANTLPQNVLSLLQ